MDTVINILLWAAIGALPGFYVFFVKQYDTRLGVLIGAALGVLVGFGATAVGLIASPLSAIATIFGLIVIALLLLPENAYPDDQKAQQPRRLVSAIIGFLLLLFLVVGLTSILPADFPVSPALITLAVIVLFLIYIVPRGDFDNQQTNAQRISNLAYALTLPTVLIVTGIVIFPVIWNVIFSLRDISVGDLRDVELFDLRELTLDNFEAQGGFRFDAIPCETDDSGACVLDEDGNITYVNPRRYFDDYRGYRQTGAIDIGDTHYALGVRNPEFYPMLLRTFLYTLASSIAAIFFGLVAALVVRESFPGRSIFRGFLLFPYIAPVISVAFIWQVLLRQNGFVNGLLGTNTQFLSGNETILGIALPLVMVILFQTWRYFPFAFLFLLARIQAIPDDIYEAAKVDGATPIQRLLYITLPQLRGVFGTLFLLRFIWTFNKFDDVYLLTGPIEQTKVIPVQIFESLFTEGNVGEASAVAVVMAAILAVTLLIYFRYFLVDEA